MEHGNADATVFMSMFRWLGKRYLTRAGGIETLIESRQYSLKFLPSPEPLHWKLSPSISSTVQNAERSFGNRASLFCPYVVRFKQFGKTKLKTIQVPPDTFVQLSLQHCAFCLFKELLSTYESGHTRYFFHGRTETIRTCTIEVMKWLHAMNNKENKQVVIEALLQAIRKHKELAIEALTGQGNSI